MKRENWFATPVWYDDTDVPDAVVEQIASKWISLSRDVQSASVSNVGGWQSHSLTYDECDSFERELFHHVDLAADFIHEDYKIKNKIVLGNWWVNINGYGNYNRLHIHGGVLSGVFYVKTAKADSGSLIFHRPSYMYEVASFTTTDLDSTALEVSYEPLDKRLILFPAWIPHSVNANFSDQKRVSIGFNYVVAQGL